MLNTVLAAGLCYAAIISNVANAGLIVNDVSDTFVTDTVTGFDWLDMSYTDGKSFNDVSTLILADTLNGGGWEIASKAEVLDLLLHQNNNVSFPYDITVSRNKAEYLSFVELKDWLTPTFTSVVNEITHSMIRGYTSDTGATHAKNFGDHVSIQFGSSSNQFAIGKGYLTVDGVGRLESERNGAWGTFLVRKTTDVPEPATVAIFALGLMGLALRKKKV